MKNIKHTLVFLLSSLFLVSCGREASKAIVNKIDEGENPYVFATDISKDYRTPDVRGGEDDDEGDEQIGEVNKVILHYVNDDNNCATRAFYIWASGVDGTEYSSKADGDIVKYAADGGMMTITIDFEDDRFAEIKEAKPTALMYIIKYQMISPSNLNWGGQSEDVELKFSSFPPVDGTVEVWCTPAAGGGIAQFATEEETKVDGVKLAYFTSFKAIDCTLTPTAGTVAWDLYAFDETYYKVKSKNRAAIKKNYLVKSGQTASKNFTISFKYNAHMNVVYAIESKDVDSTTGLVKTVFVSFEKLYYVDRFEEKYTYKGNDLGMTYTSTSTKFKVWSPVAANVTLQVYDSDTSAAYNGDDKYKGYHMFYQPNGVWALELKGDLKGKYYAYQVDTWAGNSTTIDPYATGAGACGVRGLIYDKNGEEVCPDIWETLPLQWDGVTNWNNNGINLDIDTPQRLTVYEVHIQDFTGDTSWESHHGNARGTFNAFVEEGTTLTQGGKTVKTGFDHLKELGVNAVQLMPVFDSDNDEVKNKKYNWGYNPQNYNCVEGVYSSNPHDGYARIKEFRNLILRCAQNGIRVIMDVVYNHVSSASAHSFNKLMPRYFFRYDENGELYDGSGCHNEFRSEATMARKYIVDSLKMWATDYKIKGFRFDLMGLLDVETMRKAKFELYQIDPDIYLYGEGWTSGGFHGGKDYENNKQSEGTFCCNGLGNQIYSQLYNNHEHDKDTCYIGGFNDLGRNAVKGGNDMGWGSETHHPGYGWISQGSGDASYRNRKAIESLIWGEHANDEAVIGGDPKQTVNYASCHDNWTLRDQLYQCLGSNGNAGNGYDVMHASEAVHALIFASNGVSFMLGGEELLRTKDVDLADPALVADNTIPRDSYENLYGHLTSHNSYNSPLIVNSFKWGNKISVDFDYGVDDNGNRKDPYTVDTYAEKLTEKFAKMIDLHKKMPKYDYTQIQSLKETTSKGNHVDGLSWTGSVGGECAFGIQFDEYFIYASGRSFGKVGAGSVPAWGAPLIKVGGNVEYDSGELKLGNEGYGNGFALALYYAGGKR